MARICISISETDQQDWNFLSEVVFYRPIGSDNYYLEVDLDGNGQTGQLTFVMGKSEALSMLEEIQEVLGESDELPRN